MASIGDYKIIKTLGKNSYSKVKLVENTKTNEKYSMKMMEGGEDENDQLDTLFNNEVQIWSKIEHPHMVKLIDYAELQKATTKSSDTMEINYILFEYPENGQLFEYIIKTGTLAEYTARYYLKQIIEAIEYVNEIEDVQLEIKHENLMLDSKFNIKIGDFGRCADKQGTKRKWAFSGLSPEKLADLPSTSIDLNMFSAAVLVFMMLTLQSPFARADPSDSFYSHIIMGDFNEFWEAHNKGKVDTTKLSEEFKDLFCKMVVVAPKKRLSISDVKEHKWMKGYLPNNKEIYEIFSYRKLKLEELQKESDSKFPKLITSASGTPEDQRNDK